MVRRRPPQLSTLLAALAVGGAAVASSPTPASAAPPTEAEREALRLFQEGVAALKAGSGELACQRFAESQSKNPSIGALLNLADCDEQAGKPLAAYERVNDAIALIKAKGDDRLKFAQNQAAQLDAKVPRLTLRLPEAAPGDLRVLRDGRVVPPETLGTEMKLEPGTYVFTTQSLGHLDGRRDVTLAPAERRDVVLALGTERAAATKAPGPVAKAPAPPAAPPAPAPEPSASPAHTFAWVALGVGAVGLVGGAITSALVVKKHDEFEACAIDCGGLAKEGKALLLPNALLWGAAVAGAGASVTLFLLSRGDARGDARASSSAPPALRAAVRVVAPLGDGAGRAHLQVQATF